LGESVVVLPNVTIGENSIVGANSVVTKSIPKNSVVAGNPAKIIKELQ
jgi:acetyltransferase-like isoleucine patch superfamily enzyme